MSIQTLQLATLIGLTEEKERILDQVQSIGVLHIVPLVSNSKETTVTEATKGDVSTDLYHTVLSYLLSCPVKRKQVLSERHFSLKQVIEEADTNRQRRLKKLERQEFLQKRIKELAPWGSFALPDHGELYQNRLWFYLVPNYRMREMKEVGLPWEVVHRDNRNSYVAVISEHEPPANAVPVQRTHTGAIPRDALVHELEDLEVELETLEAERESLTRWIYLLQRSLAGVEDKSERAKVSRKTLDKAEVFALQGWFAKDRLEEIETISSRLGLVLSVRDASPQDNPPTLLHNDEFVGGGEEVVHFFQMPGYRSWDPSRVVFFSFVSFFALIMSDAGYSALLGLMLAFNWSNMAHNKSLRRLRVMGSSLAVAGVVWGVLVGSYFGASPPTEWLQSLKILDLNDFDSMMTLSISIGALHLMLGNLMMAWVHRKHRTALSSVGWALSIFSALIGWIWGYHLVHWLFVAAGLALVFVFSTAQTAWNLKRFLSGMLALTNITKLFGDILSYLRLFALGLASASLAMTFNQLAMDVGDALPVIGLLFKVLILLVGHLLNCALTVISGVIHGLRLNLIEFYNWSLADEGYAFQPFAKREVTPWTT